MILATLNEPVPLQVLAADGRTDLYAQIRVYNAAGMLLNTLPAPEIAEGLYGVSWTPNIEGYYTYIAQLYFDSAFTVDAGYEKQGDSVDVNSTKTNILRLLGLHHENAIVDSQSYDGAGNLLTARVRLYNSLTTAQTQDVSGLIAQYSITASYTNGQLSNYMMVREL